GQLHGIAAAEQQNFDRGIRSQNQIEMRARKARHVRCIPMQGAVGENENGSGIFRIVYAKTSAAVAADDLSAHRDEWRNIQGHGFASLLGDQGRASAFLSVAGSRSIAPRLILRCKSSGTAATVE